MLGEHVQSPRSVILVTPDRTAVVVGRPPVSDGLTWYRMHAQASIRGARQFVRRVIAGHVPDDGHADNIELVTSELVTNAMRAAWQYAKDLGITWSPCSTPVRVGVRATDRLVELVVRDPDPSVPALTVDGGLLAESGRGLFIANIYAARIWPEPHERYKLMRAILPAADGVALSPAELRLS